MIVVRETHAGRDFRSTSLRTHAFRTRRKNVSSNEPEVRERVEFTAEHLYTTTVSRRTGFAIPCRRPSRDSSAGPWSTSACSPSDSAASWWTTTTWSARPETPSVVRSRDYGCQQQHACVTRPDGTGDFFLVVKNLIRFRPRDESNAKVGDLRPVLAVVSRRMVSIHVRPSIRFNVHVRTRYDRELTRSPCRMRMKNRRIEVFYRAIFQKRTVWYRNQEKKNVSFVLPDIRRWVCWIFVWTGSSAR